MRGWRWIWLVMWCLPAWAQPAPPPKIDQAWRDHDLAFAAQVWTDQGKAIATARARADAAVRAGHLADELRARADYLSQVLPLSAQDLAAANDALARARQAGELATAFDLLCTLALNKVVTFSGPIDDMVKELAASAEQLGDPARTASVEQVRGMAAMLGGRSADAVKLLTEALAHAPHDFRRVEILLTRADAVVSTAESRAAIESARADLDTALGLVDAEKYRTLGFQGNSSRSRLERRARNLDEALKYLREAVRLVPDSMAGTREHSSLMSEAAHALSAKKLYAEAQSVLKRIRRLDNLGPADRLAIANVQAMVTAELGGPDALAQSNAWLERGAAELDRVREEPRMVQGFHRNAATVYERTGQYAKALEAWKAAEKAGIERTERANEKLRLEFQTKLDVAAKERENATLRAAADLEAERRLRWSWAFALSAFAAAVLAAAWASSARQKRRLAELRDELAARNAQLEERSSSRIRMLAAACHDLRQPAHALGMLAELGVDAIREPGTSRTWLRSIKRCSATLSEMLGELMDLSKLDGGHYEPLIDTVPLDELLHDVRLQYAELAQRKGLAFDAPPCGLHVRSDRQLLRRMVFNGVANAVKYTRTGRVTVSAHLEHGTVTLVVADTGAGIPPEKLEEVFQDHVRLDPRQAVDGLGIGLSIVRRASQLLGHRASLDSVVGQGTRFTLELGPPVAAAGSSDMDAPDTAAMGQGTLIALIENDAAIREAMAAVLQRWGFAIVAGESADAVLAATDGAALGLVITDLHLDHGDGLEAIAQLRTRAGQPSLPALLVTGDLDAEVAARATAMQVQVSHKPLPPVRLLAAVTFALQRGGPDDASPRSAEAGGQERPSPLPAPAAP